MRKPKAHQKHGKKLKNFLLVANPDTHFAVQFEILHNVSCSTSRFGWESWPRLLFKCGHGMYTKLPLVAWSLIG